MKLAMFAPTIPTFDHMGSGHAEERIFGLKKERCTVARVWSAIGILADPVKRCDNGGGEVEQDRADAPRYFSGFLFGDHPTFAIKAAIASQ